MKATPRVFVSYKRASMALPLAALSVSVMVTGCNVDPTDPENVRPVTLVNDRHETVHVAWCGEDADCRHYDKLGTVSSGDKSKYNISSYEIVFRLTDDTGAVAYVCRDNAEGSIVKSSEAVISLDLAYKDCASV